MRNARVGWAISVFVGVCWAGVLNAQETLTPEHIARLRVVTSVAIAPGGDHVAYALSVPRRPFQDEDGPAWSELHVVDSEGQSRGFVTGEVNVGGVAWTPDGTEISFLAKRGKDKFQSLYVIPIDGGEGRKVLEHDTDIRSYAWNPDGDRVAFLATEADPEDLKSLREKGFNQQIFEEDWKFTRLWLATLEDADEGSKPTKVELEGSASELSWSPCGAKLAVALAPTPGVDDDLMMRRIHLLDAEDGEVLARLDHEGKLGAVAWSTDGKHLALISGADIHDPAPGRLLVGSAEGGETVDVLPDYEGHVSALAWKNEDTIAFLGDEGVWTTLNTIKRDGSNHETIVPTGKLVATALDLSKEGDASALVGESARHPNEVYLSSSRSESPRRLTDSNPWLDDVSFAEQEVISYKARDGLEQEGILIRPLNPEPSRRYPLLLSVHGGPEAHERNGWQTAYAKPGHVAAARGFAVFYPNYRGSTGRGVEFSKLGQADPAGKEFDDLVDAVDHLVEIGLVDKDKVGITGGSYGGYASAWGATYYSEHFAASVMFVGISDKISKSGTTDIPEEEYLVHARKRPWDDWKFFLERSPLYHVEQARTPILILHGKEDPRVHPGQSLELYRYLKLIDQAPVRLVLYPGEGHGNRRSASRYDYHLRMLRWFEHYLQGPGGEPPDYELEYPLQEKKDEPEAPESEEVEK